MLPERRYWIFALLLFAAVFPPTAGSAAQYAVDGFAVGGPAASDNPRYAAYRCGPSPYFAGSTYCQRSAQASGRLGRAVIAFSLIHDQAGAPLYAMANVAPIALSKPIIETEIGRLSNVIGEQPGEIKWTPADTSGKAAVIVTWGRVKLEELGGDELDMLRTGKSPHVGMLVDYLGDLQRSAKDYQSVFRITGGPGYVYAAGFDADGRGHRHYVAIDASQIAARQYEVTLAGILQKDRALAANDYSLWPEVATETRKLARDTSASFANQILDQVFERQSSTKLRSHVWSTLPLGAIPRLATGKFSRLDIYGPKTRYPQIKSDTERLLRDERSDPFIAFAYFLHGDIDRAMTANHADLIVNVLHYATGYGILQSLLQDILHVARLNPNAKGYKERAAQLKSLVEETPETANHVIETVRFFNQDPVFRETATLPTMLPGSDARLAAAQSQFEEVARHSSSAIADDAAYLSGWISVQLGKPDLARASYARAMVIGNGDYSYAALKEMVRELQEQPVEDALAVLTHDKNLSSQPALWYTVARSAYRKFDFQRAIDISEQGLRQFNVPVERLPVSTDLSRIRTALERIDPKLVDQINIREMPYLIEASREMLRYQRRLDAMRSEAPESFAPYAKAVIVKYSLLRDPPMDPKTGELLAPRKTAHNDFRQAAHLIELSLRTIPRDPAYTALREWLRFRYVRVLTTFDPARIPDAIAAMRQEFPASDLIDDAMAEQVYAFGIMKKDTKGAERAFLDLLRQYPNANAVDNAYSWMAITERCVGHNDMAEYLNKEIVRRFPFSRHAGFAKARLANPGRYLDDNSCGPYTNYNY